MNEIYMIIRGIESEALTELVDLVVYVLERKSTLHKHNNEFLSLCKIKFMNSKENNLVERNLRYPMFIIRYFCDRFHDFVIYKKNL